jgi:hypothetical protein
MPVKAVSKPMARIRFTRINRHITQQEHVRAFSPLWQSRHIFRGQRGRRNSRKKTGKLITKNRFNIDLKLIVAVNTS